MRKIEKFTVDRIEDNTVILVNDYTGEVIEEKKDMFIKEGMHFIKEDNIYFQEKRIGEEKDIDELFNSLIKK